MKHILAVHVENKPGVLAHVSSLFARRGFNIHSLTVGPALEPNMSRMTVVVDAPELEQVKKQLFKLVNVVKITELSAEEAIEREIMLVRVAAPPEKRGEIKETASMLDGRVLDVGPGSLTFEVTGHPTKLADFLDLMQPYGVVDIVKSGRVALKRDLKSRDVRAAG